MIGEPWLSGGVHAILTLMPDTVTIGAAIYNACVDDCMSVGFEKEPKPHLLLALTLKLYDEPGTKSAIKYDVCV